MIILLIPILVLMIYIFLQIIHSKHITNNSVVAFTGGLGSGKTFHAVRFARRAYKILRFRYLIGRIPLLGQLLLKLRLATKYNPHFYSNIPVVLRYRRNKPIFTQPLTREHLMMTAQVEEGSVLLIDEIGQFASQYDFDNPYVCENVQTFIRFFRHFINGYLFVTDQCSANIVVPIRRRLSVIYNLNDFHRVGILPIYKCKVKELTVCEEQLQNINDIVDVSDGEFFCGYLGYFRRKLYYDSRCYSVLYMNQPEIDPPIVWTGLKTKYLIDIDCSYDVRQKYKKYRCLDDKK